MDGNRFLRLWFDRRRGVLFFGSKYLFFNFIFLYRIFGIVNYGIMEEVRICDI